MSDERDICEEWNAKKWSNEAPMLRGFGDLLAAEIRRLRGEERIEGWAAKVDQPWRWEFGVGGGFTPGPTSRRAALIVYKEGTP